MDMGWYYGLRGDYPIGMFIGFMIFIVLIVVFGFMFVNYFSNKLVKNSPKQSIQDPNDPKLILDRRFASGEITEQEYRDALRVLGYPDNGPSASPG